MNEMEAIGFQALSRRIKSFSLSFENITLIGLLRIDEDLCEVRELP